MYILCFLLAMCGLGIVVAGQVYPAQPVAEYFWPGVGLLASGLGLLGLLAFFFADD